MLNRLHALCVTHAHQDQEAVRHRSAPSRSPAAPCSAKTMDDARQTVHPAPCLVCGCGSARFVARSRRACGHCDTCMHATRGPQLEPRAGQGSGVWGAAQARPGLMRPRLVLRAPRRAG
ncbi:hypothetical protein WOLCODRAFT_147148 [Wolfiporia cocos MD-104 SS10]|uniref:Uncharacterized protein n=1 Tax=Wolfiporia cocos (strain MD-104) TaxID=742152 RepID=A0A2H3IZS8_WOLCO|nr:hypothetical protein WOLCODRAFT_147148 [Wolfiporia cocos MD-104 SS10]